MTRALGPSAPGPSATTRGGASPRRPGSLLDQLSPRDRSHLQRFGRPTSFGRGETLIPQGDDHPAVYLLTGGVVKATRTALPDSPPMLITLFFPGDAPGTADALLRSPAHITYTATKPTRALAVPRERFTDFVEYRREVTRTALAVLANELRVRDMHLAHSTMDVRGRLVAFLGRQQVVSGVPTPEGVMLDLGLTQADLAAAIGAAPGTVGRELASLQERGVIGMGYCTIYIKKRLSPHSPEPEY
ncbi:MULTISPECIES: Crp/Fnr family transcriptional regulator [Actinosynnema]|uniref:Crp/Fnr family transcriptional regulator n=1 Tax=Actinosynnema TaxID=40566 RepID=UPI0020A481A0|nr:Crp/Fnr family transcriptional regulator [Actinosynnema pretiosum]MCP2098656.1 transcriptional regulator, Crp/Fnr family [Actinosynnema pretiosum]